MATHGVQWSNTWMLQCTEWTSFWRSKRLALSAGISKELFVLDLYSFPLFAWTELLCRNGITIKKLRTRFVKELKPLLFCPSWLRILHTLLHMLARLQYKTPHLASKGSTYSVIKSSCPGCFYNFHRIMYVSLRLYS